MDNPLVSVVVLNFNGLRFLDACLRSILSQSYSPYEVILVDNHSSDDSVAFVREHFPDVRLLAPHQNLGYAGGNNLGVSHARGELVVLLNNDTTVEANWLARLVRALDPDDVVIASSLVRTEGIPEEYYEQNGSINFLGHNIMRVFRHPSEIFYAGGTSLIFKKSVIGTPFDADYFAYSEDVYLSLRARFMGYSVVQVPQSVVQHAGGGAARQTPRAWLTMLQERNRLLNIILFFSFSTQLKLIPLFLLNLPAKCFLALLRRYSLTGILRAYFWFPVHLPAIREKRRQLRRQFHRSEEEIIALMSGRLTNGESTFTRLVDAVALGYCSLVGLKTIEHSRRAGE